MKLFKSFIYFVLVPIMIIGVLLITKNWIKIALCSDESVVMITDDSETVVPLIDKSTVKFKTSDESYVCLSCADKDDLIEFYEETGQYKAIVSAPAGIVLQNDTSLLTIKILSKELNCITYSIRYLPSVE